MEINKKQLLIAAAVGAAAWFMLRKKAPAAAGGKGGASALGDVINAISGSARGITGGNIVSTKPEYLGPAGVYEIPVQPAASGDYWGGPVSGASPPITGAVFGGAPANSTPAPAPAPAPSGGAVFGGGPATPAPAPGSTFAHLTPAQRGGKTDGQLALSILGY